MGLFGGGSGADWLIAGLGNPEPKYDGTRHNTGFAALDALAEAWGCEINKSKWQGLYGIAQVDGRKVMLLKPLTYMNLSGQSIAPAAAHPHPALRFCWRAQRAKEQYRFHRRRGFLPHPHWRWRQAAPGL